MRTTATEGFVSFRNYKTWFHVSGDLGGDARRHADAAQEMLVHRVVMVHIELHHRDDRAKSADELT